MMVLVMLRERARYGYDIAKELKDMSGGKLEFRRGTLYPILHKLEKQDLIKGVWEHPEDDRSRRVYVLTDKGSAEAERQIEAWLEYANAVQHIIKETAGESA